MTDPADALAWTAHRHRACEAAASPTAAGARGAKTAERPIDEALRAGQDAARLAADGAPAHPRNRAAVHADLATAWARLGDVNAAGQALDAVFGLEPGMRGSRVTRRMTALAGTLEERAGTDRRARDPAGAAREFTAGALPAFGGRPVPPALGDQPR